MDARLSISTEDTLKLLRQGLKEELEGTLQYREILRYDLPENVSKTLARIDRQETQHPVYVSRG